MLAVCKATARSCPIFVRADRHTHTHPRAKQKHRKQKQRKTQTQKQRNKQASQQAGRQASKASQQASKQVGKQARQASKQASKQGKQASKTTNKLTINHHGQVIDAVAQGHVRKHHIHIINTKPEERRCMNHQHSDQSVARKGLGCQTPCDFCPKRARQIAPINTQYALYQ